MKISFIKYLAVLTLFTLVCPGFCSCMSTLFASESYMIAKKTSKSRKREKKKDVEKKDDQDLFLKEATKNNDYLPDIYRCPVCGYEQDEPGTCPDHNKTPLIKILSKGRSPLMPTELDGNEDILVDIPLKSLEFKKVTLDNIASSTDEINTEAKSGGDK